MQSGKKKRVFSWYCQPGNRQQLLRDAQVFQYAIQLIETGIANGELSFALWGVFNGHRRAYCIR